MTSSERSGKRQPSRPAQRPGTRRPGKAERKGPKVPEARGTRTPQPIPDAEVSGGESENQMRLQKFLAMSGVDSRRKCEEYIRDGRVTVDGEVVTDPARSVSAESNDVRLDSERLRPARPRYFLLNKPKGVLCTNHDPAGRTRAVDLVPVADQRLFTVGRLDENTEGLLLLTNDGDLAQRLAHPRFEVIRRYRVQVAGAPTIETLQQLRDGMYFSEGFFRFRGVRVVGRRGRSTILELELQEGKNREIRRLLARVGHKVMHLERIAFGPLTLGTLPPGRHRELQPAEVRELRHFLETGERSPKPAGRSFGYRPGKTRSAKKKRIAPPRAEQTTHAAKGTRGAARSGRPASPSNSTRRSSPPRPKRKR